VYISHARPIWCKLDAQLVCLAYSLADAKTGKRIAERIAMIAMTTRSSISVKPLFELFFECVEDFIFISVSSYV
jgi:hypothetical protein